ncbi:MAG: phosphoglycerate mutase (2,3-diphosphoglycerate-independent), partial [Moraxellaceae bacterium]
PESIQNSYDRDVTDEFLMPLVNGSLPSVNMKDGDVVICFNFRTDRCREITEVLTQHPLTDFGMIPLHLDYNTMTQYDETYRNVNCFFNQDDLKNTLGEVLKDNGKSQLRIAETEKYPHVSFFFSGGREVPFEGEKRIMIPSPKVATYDLKPEMSAFEVTEELVAAINSGDYDVLIVNYANGDMVGHTGIFDAAVKAVEAIDVCMGRVYEAVMAQNGHMLITADHGNVEQMMDYDSGQVHTQHTTEYVPLIYVGPTNATIASGGVLADVAPTLLSLMQIQAPVEMTGRNLLFLDPTPLGAGN